MIDAARLAVDEIAGIQRSVINLQYAVEKMQFFGARMLVCRIIAYRAYGNSRLLAICCRMIAKATEEMVGSD